MDTSWWLVFAAVVLLALVATLVDGWGRGGRPRGRGRRPRKGGTSGTGPAGGGPKTEAPRDAYVAGRFAGRSRQAQSWPCRVSMAASVVSAV